MPNSSRGLPKDFHLNVPAAPVALGDYLDEQALAPPPKPSEVSITNVDLHRPSGTSTDASKRAQAEPNQDQIARQSGPPRKQFNMTPETLRMVDELLIHIRNHSAERDVRASELFHALVLTVYEVRPFLDLSRVPLRGRWGSTSAAALPVAMKEAFRDAIARAQQRR